MENKIGSKADTYVCSLCPRNCKATRTGAENRGGFCRLPLLPGVCRAAAHHWEEPCISGSRGSGAVFFSGCTLRCEFCQNVEISRDYCGKIMTADELSEAFEQLEESGVHNINLVSPTPYYPVIIDALRKRKPGIPVICNTSGYEKVETLKALEGLIDIYLPDFKYSDPKLSAEYSAAADYPDAAKSAIEEMYRQVGAPVIDDDGLIKKGLMIRHLVLPDEIENSLGVLDIISETVPKSVYLSLMAQYFPTGNEKHENLKRRVTDEEYEQVRSYALMLGLTNGYCQELASSSSAYVPHFYK